MKVQSPWHPANWEAEPRVTQLGLGSPSAGVAEGRGVTDRALGWTRRAPDARHVEGLLADPAYAARSLEGIHC